MHTGVRSLVLGEMLLALSIPACSSGAAATDGSTQVTPEWQNKERYGGGPSVGAPRSDFMGAKPPTQWCLLDTLRASGDLGYGGEGWDDASRMWLRQVLSDTTEMGRTWRKVLGGAPLMTGQDSIVRVTSEAECKRLAEIVNAKVLGWKVGLPPVVVYRVRDFVLVFPSNARMGEWGLAVGMNSKFTIRGVAMW